MSGREDEARSSVDTDRCTEARARLLTLELASESVFVISFRVVVEDDDDTACDGTDGCCEERAREERRGDMVRSESVVKRHQTVAVMSRRDQTRCRRFVGNCRRQHCSATTSQSTERRRG